MDVDSPFPIGPLPMGSIYALSLAPSERFKAAAAPISSVRSCAAAPVPKTWKFPKTLGHQTWGS